MTQEIKNEWGFYIGHSAFKSSSTKRTYKLNHIRITSYLKKPIHQSSELEIIECVNNISNNQNSKGLLLNCGIVFYNLYNLDNTLLIQERNKKDVYVENLNTLPTLKDLEIRIKYLFYNERWRDTIILFLLINYNCRTSDLNIEIVNSIHETKRDKKRNYIVIRKEDFVFIRNNYKTRKVFGQLRFKFKSVLFSRAVKYYCALQPPNFPVYLIHHDDGEYVKDCEVNDFIEISTNGLTEADINKIQILDIKEKGDFERLKQLAERRGEDLRTLMFLHEMNFEVVDKI